MFKDREGNIHRKRSVVIKYQRIDSNCLDSPYDILCNLHACRWI